MQKKQVAVLDVGSSKLSAVVGERGMNKTFVFKGDSKFNYDGFGEGAFFNVEELKRTIISAVEFLKKTCTGKLDTIYVGVPGEFTKTIVKDSQISFSKKKKISSSDVDALFDSAFVIQSSKHTLINRSAVVYELDDFRRLVNPVGSVSEILKGRLSFIVCDNYFTDIFRPVIKSLGIEKVEFVSSCLAQALYLIEPELRDRIALVCDVGYITSTLMLVQGDGILFEKSFTYGGGFITAAITEKYQMEFDCAENLKRKVNLSCNTSSKDFDLLEADNGQYYSVEEVKNIIKNSLDLLCEFISDALDESGYDIPDYVSLMITGGGIANLRGAKEHVSGRLNTVVEILAPKVPLLDKPEQASLLSLLDIALEQN